MAGPPLSALGFAETLALCEAHRVSKLVSDGSTVVIEFFRPREEFDVKQAGPSPGLSYDPAAHAHAPEVEEAVAALDRAYDDVDPVPEDEAPARDTAAIIAAVDAEAKAGA